MKNLINQIAATTPDPRTARRFVERKSPIKTVGQPEGHVPVDKVTVSAVAASTALAGSGIYKYFKHRGT